jgi:hypothetical protein
VVGTFTITSFEAAAAMAVTAGTFSDIGPDIKAHDWFWDATGSSTPPVLRGDPTPGTVLAWTGHVTFEPPTIASGGPLHGWFGTWLGTETSFDDVSRTLVKAWVPMYSTVDLSAPENVIACCMTSPTSFAEGFSFGAPTGSALEYGDSTIRTNDFLPLPTVPMIGPMTVHVSFVGYRNRAVDLPPATLQMRHDFDFHHNKPGIIDWQKLDTFDGDQGPETLTIDPAVLGPGAHKVGFIRTQSNPDGTETASTLMVFDVLVDSSVPPPTCQDPTAINIGGPLPCVFPPPQPPTTTLTCAGQIIATSTDGGASFTVPSGSLSCGAGGTFKVTGGTVTGSKQ